ncbi:MAG: hypothetical protein DI589_24005 [Shinella sp.]|nr:MAG: hypothetical protein DI589_24005 [Shinella sp.]
MTNKLSSIEARIGSVQQLSTVVSAMRGIAAVRSREARQALDGIRTYAATVSAAIAEVLATMPALPVRAGVAGGGVHILVLLMSEQGFVGAFNERIVEAARQMIAASGGADWEIFVAGNRGAVLLAESGVSARSITAMIEHSAQAGELAGELSDRLFQRLGEGDVAEVLLLHGEPTVPVETVGEKRLAPFDYTRFSIIERAKPPLMTLPPEHLLERLAEEFAFAELSEAIVLSFAAENAARTRAMTEANANAEKTLEELRQLYRLSRQEEITDEIIELAAGVLGRQS